MNHKILVGTTCGLHELSEGKHTQLTGHDVTSLSISKSGWWAIIDGQEVWHCKSARVWSRIASLKTLNMTCLLETSSKLFVGTSEATLLTLECGMLHPVISFNQVEGREHWYTPWGGPPDVRSMSADPSGTVYVNVHVGGVVRSTNAGKSWEPTIDIDSDVHQILFDPGSGMTLAASARGLAISKDNGTSWQFETNGLHGNYLRAVAVAGSSVLVTASTGPKTESATVYRASLNTNAPFTLFSRALPELFSDNIDTFCLSTSGTSVAFGTTDGSIFLSQDEGTSWKLVTQGLPPIRCVAIL